METVEKWKFEHLHAIWANCQLVEAERGFLAQLDLLPRCMEKGKKSPAILVVYEGHKLKRVGPTRLCDAIESSSRKTVVIKIISTAFKEKKMQNMEANVSTVGIYQHCWKKSV